MGPLWAQVNGQLQDGLPLSDRGLAFGDGLFETIRIELGRVPLWPFHLARLRSGCDRLGITFPADGVDAALRAAVQAASHLYAARLKIMVTRGTGGRGWQPAAVSEPTVAALVASELPAPRPLTLQLVRHRLPHNPALAGLKSLSGLDYVLAGIELSESSADDGLLLCADGAVVETLRHNVFAVIDRQLCTPDLQRCGVAGVARAWLLQQSNLAVEVRQLALAELLEADEVFVTNALIGVAPVVAIGGRPIAGLGPVTRSVQAAFGALFRGNHPCEA